MENGFQLGDFDMPDNLINSEMTHQIIGDNTTLDVNDNYLDYFIKKHEIQKALGESDDDENEAEPIQVSADIEEQFYGDVINKLRNIAGILIDTGSGFSLDLLRVVYGMFVVRRYPNIVDHITAYILNNKNQIASGFNDDSTSNMSVKTARRTFKYKIDATIAVHCGEIVDAIICNPEIMHPEAIVSMLYQTNPDDYEFTVVNSMVQTCALSFDVDHFINHTQTIFTEPMINARLKADILERILPLFKKNEGV